MGESPFGQIDTIAALSSGSVPAGVAVIRVSGPKARQCVESLTRREPPIAGSFSLRTFWSGGEALDEGLVLWFEGPKSFTGEDVAEFQSHGGRAVVDGVLEALSAIDGVRFAEPGEFSRQAFHNGRLDLTEVEGLSDLIEAETPLQRKQAFSQMNGALSKLYEEWRGDLIRCLGHVEAEIDFADEDLPDELSVLVLPKIEVLRQAIRKHLEGASLGERVRDGFRVAIFGPPNVGKSSLLNLLAQRDVAIVSDRPGTTRDFLEIHLNIGGVPVTVVDTAGLRDAEDDVERIGVERAMAQIESADIRIYMRDVSSFADDMDFGFSPNMVLVNKTDLVDQNELALSPSELTLSVKTGAGVDELLSSLEKMLREQLSRKPAIVPTRIRHRSALDRCVEALDRVLEVSAEEPDLLAEELRVAMRALGEITGRAGVEDMLDVVFKEFCIGK